MELFRCFVAGVFGVSTYLIAAETTLPKGWAVRMETPRSEWSSPIELADGRVFLGGPPAASLIDPKEKSVKTIHMSEGGLNLHVGKDTVYATPIEVEPGVVASGNESGWVVTPLTEELKQKRAFMREVCLNTLKFSSTARGVYRRLRGFLWGSVGG